jgi:hypothetical protein
LRLFTGHTNQISFSFFLVIPNMYLGFKRSDELYEKLRACGCTAIGLNILIKPAGC